MNDPIEIIKLIKEKMAEVISENNFKYLDVNLDDLFVVYSADLCSILLNYFPGGTIMINKNYRLCGVMIEGIVYTSKGVADINDYKIANEQEIGYIQKSFNQLSDYVLRKLNKKLCNIDNTKIKGISYVLRKNIENLT